MTVEKNLFVRINAAYKFLVDGYSMRSHILRLGHRRYCFWYVDGN